VGDFEMKWIKKQIISLCSPWLRGCFSFLPCERLQFPLVRPTHTPVFVPKLAATNNQRN